MPILDVVADLYGGSSLAANALASRPLTASLAGSSTLTGQLLYVLSADLVGDSSLIAEPTAQYAAQATLVGEAGFTSFLNVVIGPVAPVRYNVPSRAASAGKLIFDQVDLFLGDGKTRAQDVLPADLALRVYLNGKQLDWPLVSGAGVNDVQATSGKVYWTEFTTGFYSVRFFPNAIGEWRILVTSVALDQAVSLGYNVTPAAGVASGPGLQSSFIRRIP